MPQNRSANALRAAGGVVAHLAAAGFELAFSAGLILPRPGTAGSGCAKARRVFRSVKAVLPLGSEWPGSEYGSVLVAMGSLWTVRTRDGIELDVRRVDEKSDGHKGETLSGVPTGTGCNGL